MKTVLIHFKNMPFVVPYEFTQDEQTGNIHIVVRTASPQLSKYFKESIEATLTQSGNTLNTKAFANEDAMQIQRLIINQIFRVNDIDYIY